MRWGWEQDSVNVNCYHILVFSIPESHWEPVKSCNHSSLPLGKHGNEATKLHTLSHIEMELGQCLNGGCWGKSETQDNVKIPDAEIYEWSHWYTQRYSEVRNAQNCHFLLLYLYNWYSCFTIIITNTILIYYIQF